MKANLEKISPAFGSSFTVRRFGEDKINEQHIPYWHFHPEYEIVYITNGRGKRHIGNHISFFEDGDLLFVGPNLPHFGFTDEIRGPHTEIVVQMKSDFLGEHFLGKPELLAIKQLFERSHQVISFGSATRERVGERLEALVETTGFNRLIGLLTILQDMALSKDYQTLQAEGYAVEVSAQDRDRMESVFAYVSSGFRERLSLTVAAQKTNMTVPAFCRYFKRITSKTFSQFVNEYRIAHACRLLGDETMTIAAISFESGFNNLSHFNRQFKSITGISPSAYRSNIRKIVEG